ncbi:MAG: hypothetical protein RLZZ524_919 [Pseudomonadota bacterium]
MAGRTSPRHRVGLRPLRILFDVSLTHLCQRWRFLIAVLLLLALPLQAAELARMVVCPPGMGGHEMGGQEMAQGHDHAGAHEAAHAHAMASDHDPGDGHHADHASIDPASADTGSGPGHAHHGSGCCKTCLAGCGSWVVAAPIEWPAPGWTPARFPRLTLAGVPEPLARGLERPPRTSNA